MLLCCHYPKIHIIVAKCIFVFSPGQIFYWIFFVLFQLNSLCLAFGLKTLVSCYCLGSHMKNSLKLFIKPLLFYQNDPKNIFIALTYFIVFVLES